jgi:hypothetical protein
VNVTINPGSGPALEATEEQAEANMLRFTSDLAERGIPSTCQRTADKDYGDGRYAYLVTPTVGEPQEVQMPGLPLDQVRWLGAEGQDIWDFPRLYVNGNSWIWYFALNRFDPDDAPQLWPNGTIQGGEPIEAGEPRG